MTNSLVLSVAQVVTDAPRPPDRVVLYGVHGIGKTSFASNFPDPVFIEAEQSLATLGLKLARFPEKPTRLSDVYEAIESLSKDEHAFKTIVIDTLDALEPLVWDAVCAENNWASIESPGYGKGYVAALDKWRQILAGLDWLRAQRGMGIVLIAHAHVKRFESPIVDPYDRYILKLHEKSAALVCEWADHVIFANYRVAVTKSKRGEVTRGVGSGDRTLFAEERPGFWAKNRGLPSEMPMDWTTFSQHLNKTTSKTGA